MQKQNKKYREIVSYIFWGGMTTFVSWGSYSLFALVIRHGETVGNYVLATDQLVFIANILSFLVAFLFAFVVNKIFVFQSKSWKFQVWILEFGKFFSARVITGILEIVLVPLLVRLGLNQKLFEVEGFIAKIFVSVAIVVLNYVFSKFFIFKNK